MKKQPNNVKQAQYVHKSSAKTAYKSIAETVRLNLDCTSEECELLQTVANQEGKSVSDWIFSLARERMQNHHHLPEAHSSEILTAIDQEDGVCGFCSIDELLESLKEDVSVDRDEIAQKLEVIERTT
jgi:uncharacterized protein (DUF1778 family)